MTSLRDKNYSTLGTILATAVADSGTFTASGDAITVELIQPNDMPAVIRISWPDAPTTTPPAASTK